MGTRENDGIPRPNARFRGSLGLGMVGSGTREIPGRTLGFRGLDQTLIDFLTAAWTLVTMSLPTSCVLRDFSKRRASALKKYASSWKIVSFSSLVVSLSQKFDQSNVRHLLILPVDWANAMSAFSWS